MVRGVELGLRARSVVTNVIHRERVTNAFDRASDYDRFATVQREAAAALAGRIGVLRLPEDPAILEIGCGTGFLTREVTACCPSGHCTVTDKAPRMVERCQNAIGASPRRRFAVLDGAYGMEPHQRRYDLICSSMAMQWFDDLQTAVGRLVAKLAPGGHLVFNTLAAGTFREWREAHRATGCVAGTVDFPAVASLREMLARFAPLDFAVDHLVEHHRSARDFLARLKLIGAGTARPGHRPLPVGTLRQVIARFEHGGARATYEVVTCHIVNRATE